MVNTICAANPQAPQMQMQKNLFHDTPVSTSSLLDHQRGGNRDQASIHSSFLKLQKQMVDIGFSDWESIREADVYGGVLYPFARFLRYLLQEGAPEVTMSLMGQVEGFLIEDNDDKLIVTLFRALSDRFAYRPCITAAQYCKGASPLSAVSPNTKSSGNRPLMKSPTCHPSGAHVAAKILVVRDCVSLFMKAKAELERDARQLRDILAIECGPSANDSSTKPILWVDRRANDDRSKLAVSLLRQADSSPTTGKRISPLVASALTALDSSSSARNTSLKGKAIRPDVSLRLDEEKRKNNQSATDHGRPIHSSAQFGVVHINPDIVSPSPTRELCCRHAGHLLARRDPVKEQADEQQQRLAALHKALNRVAREPLPQ
eukprot:GILI01032408.1.p1 GENE.GILI01032408.1~~GILI01032408.1.p1  ORF type:complete len:375 (-),score=28.47 GILI01032408.1:70-1194(-)